eukprot:193104_1
MTSVVQSLIVMIGIGNAARMYLNYQIGLTVGLGADLTILARQLTTSHHSMDVIVGRNPSCRLSHGTFHVLVPTASLVDKMVGWIVQSLYYSIIEYIQKD